MNYAPDFRKLSAGVLAITTLFTLSAGATAQTVLTVREAEFRNRWNGKQEDRLVTPQYFAPGGGLDEETPGELVGEEEPGAMENWSDSVDRMAENVKRGLRFGPLDFQLGLSTGWEYSNQNSYGSGTDSNKKNENIRI
ncbi:MAG: hypothetical protein ACKOAS_05720 [Verrucomicrobiota bacterium]